MNVTECARAQGIYLDQQATIRDALRLLFRHHGMEPLYKERIEEDEKVQEEKAA